MIGPTNPIPSNLDYLRERANHPRMQCGRRRGSQRRPVLPPVEPSHCSSHGSTNPALAPTPPSGPRRLSHPPGPREPGRPSAPRRQSLRPIHPGNRRRTGPDRLESTSILSPRTTQSFIHRRYSHPTSNSPRTPHGAQLQIGQLLHDIELCQAVTSDESHVQTFPPIPARNRPAHQRWSQSLVERQDGWSDGWMPQSFSDYRRFSLGSHQVYSNGKPTSSLRPNWIAAIDRQDTLSPSKMDRFMEKMDEAQVELRTHTLL